MSETRKSVTLHRLRAMHAGGEKIAMLTCYDASFARLLDAVGVDVLLIGDSLGMVLQGHASTVPASLDEMAYHTQCVARGNTQAWIVGDLPFGSYHESTDQAMRSAARLMQSGTDIFGVANLTEAHHIRCVGKGWPILMLGACLPEEIPAAVRDDVRPTISSLAEAQAFAAAALRAHKVLPVHV